MEIMILTPDERTISLNVNPRITVENLKALMEDETRVPVEHQKMMFNDKEMKNSRRLSKYGVDDGDLVQMVSISRTVSPSSTKSKLGFNLDGSAVNPSAFRQHLLNDHDMMAGIYMNDPELAKILHEDDLDWLQLFLRTRHSQKAELQRQLMVLVDTGAMLSVMSESCAKDCGLSKLVDTSFTKPIYGVGGLKQNRAGRISIAPVKIGNVFCLGAFDLLKHGKCIFGMDILRKNQCVVDIKAGVLRIRGGDDVPFLKR